MKLRLGWTLLMLAALSSLNNAIAQQAATYRIEDPQYMISKWDETNQRVLSFRSQTSKFSAGIQITEIDGSKAVRIDVVKDFPGAIGAVVSDVASGPGRSVVAVCRVIYETPKLKPPKLKELILTYASSGALIKIWDIAPYENGAISVDEDGNVYSFGVSIHAGKIEEKATIVEYSPDGKVLKEMLPLSLFPLNTNPTLFSIGTGPCLLSVSRDKIYVYAAILSEVFVLDKSGNILNRYTTKSAVRDIAAAHHYASYEIGRGFFDSDANLYFNLRLYDAVQKALPGQIFVAAKLDSEAKHFSQWPVAKTIQPWHDPRLIGVAAEGFLVSLVATDSGTTVEIANH